MCPSPLCAPQHPPFRGGFNRQTTQYCCCHFLVPHLSLIVLVHYCRRHIIPTAHVRQSTKLDWLFPGIVFCLVSKFVTTELELISVYVRIVNVHGPWVCARCWMSMGGKNIFERRRHPTHAHVLPGSTIRTRYLGAPSNGPIYHPIHRSSRAVTAAIPGTIYQVRLSGVLLYLVQQYTVLVPTGTIF